MTHTKKCSICGIEKSANDFHMARTNKDGLRPDCKLCRKLKIPAHKQKLIPQNPNNKLCSKCKVEKPKNDLETLKKYDVGGSIDE